MTPQELDKLRFLCKEEITAQCSRTPTSEEVDLIKKLLNEVNNKGSSFEQAKEELVKFAKTRT